MLSKVTRIVNPQGFHMRPVSEFVKGLVGLQSSVFIEVNNNRIDAKSLLNIMAAGLKCGQEIKIITEGVDEQVALDRAVEMIENMKD